MPKLYGQNCPVARTLELVGDRWTLLIVRDLVRGPQRFQDLLTAQAGLAPAVLSERLKHLEQHGLIHREFYSEHPPRARYELTDMGSGLAQIIGTMAVWGSRYLLPDAPLTHAECGSRLEAGFYAPAVTNGYRVVPSSCPSLDINSAISGARRRWICRCMARSCHDCHPGGRQRGGRTYLT